MALIMLYKAVKTCNVKYEYENYNYKKSGEKKISKEIKESIPSLLTTIIGQHYCYYIHKTNTTGQSTSVTTLAWHLNSGDTSIGLEAINIHRLEKNEQNTQRIIIWT